MSSAEYLTRQQSKIQPLRRTIPYLHVHKKGCRFCRELKRQRKIAQHQAELATLEKLGNGLLELGKDALDTTAKIGSSVARAHGTAIGAWLGNSDPITWGAGALATVAYVTWLTATLKGAADKLNLPLLSALIPDIGKTTRETIHDILANTFPGSTNPPPPPPDTVTVRTFWTVDIINPGGTLRQERFYTDKGAAEQGFTASQISLTLGPLGLSPGLEWASGTKLLLQENVEHFIKGQSQGVVTTLLKQFP